MWCGGLVQVSVQRWVWVGCGWGVGGWGTSRAGMGSCHPRQRLRSSALRAAASLVSVRAGSSEQGKESCHMVELDVKGMA